MSNALYPAAIDSDLREDFVGNTPTAGVHAALHDRISKVLKAIETTLGLNPHGTYPDVATRLASILGGGVAGLSTQSGTIYSLVASDAGRIVGMSNANPNQIAVPKNADVAFPIGTIVTLRQAGAGQSSVVSDFVSQADTFTRTVALGGNWGNNDSGSAWSPLVGEDAVTNQYSVNGTQGVFGAVSNSLGQTLQAYSVADVEMLARFNVSALPTGGGHFAQLSCRRSVGNNYRGMLLITTAGDIQLQINKSVAGVSTTLAGPTTIAAAGFNAADWWWMRFRVVGSTIQLKAWKDGTVEPSGWTFNITDASLASPGFLAIRHTPGSGNTAMGSTKVDDFTATAIQGVTLNSRGGAMKLVGQYSYAQLFKVAIDTWELSGDITT